MTTAQVKITQLPAAGAITGVEILPSVQGGATVKVTVNALAGYTVQQLNGPTGASEIGYTPSGTGAVTTTVETKLRQYPSVKDFGALGDGVNDDTAEIQAALDAGVGPIYFPPGTYVVSGEIVVPDSSGIVGAGAHWKRRTGYVYDAKQTVFKYMGIGGANTCVVRLSNKAVGIQGTDFSGAETDDLVNVVAKDFHIDCNNLADFGLYTYRAGNLATVGNITAEKAKSVGQVFLGCYAAHFGVFGSYSNEGKGFVVGDNIFLWSNDYQCYSFHAKLLAAGNGTLGTFVEGSATDRDGCGAIVRVGRGSKVSIGSEGNTGRSCVLGGSGTAGGPAIFSLDYLEGNSAGPLVIYRPADSGIVLRDGFLYPRGGAAGAPETVTIQARTNSEVVTTNEGPVSPDEWLVLENLQGTSGLAAFTISSNTYKYRVRNCSGGISYTNKRPLAENTFASGFFKGDATLSDTRSCAGETIVDLFTGDGTTDTFILSANVTSAALTDVYVNGVKKTAGTHYSITGTSLLFVPAQIPALDAVITVKYSNLVLTRTAAGRYTLTWSTPQPDAEYAVTLSLVQSTGAALVFLGTLATTYFEIRTVATATPATPVDTGAYVSFSVQRIGALA